MKKNFTKQDLQSGDIVVLRCGATGAVIKEKEGIIYKDGGRDEFVMFTDDLLYDDGDRDQDIIEVYRHSNIMGFNEYQDGHLVYEREEDGYKCWDYEEYKKMIAEKSAKKQDESDELAAKIKAENNNLIRIVTQAFYGNRVVTEVDKDKIDKFICGYISDEILFTEKVDRSIIRIPGTENLVMIYNKYQEEERLEDKEKAYKERGYVIKPLAVIPELGIELYSRCIVCRISEDGELESLQKGDNEKFMKYLAM